MNLLMAQCFCDLSKDKFKAVVKFHSLDDNQRISKYIILFTLFSTRSRFYSLYILTLFNNSFKKEVILVRYSKLKLYGLEFFSIIYIKLIYNKLTKIFATFESSTRNSSASRYILSFFITSLSFFFLPVI